MIKDPAKQQRKVFQELRTLQSEKCEGTLKVASGPISHCAVGKKSPLYKIRERNPASNGLHEIIIILAIFIFLHCVDDEFLEWW